MQRLIEYYCCVGLREVKQCRAVTSIKLVRGSNTETLTKAHPSFTWIGLAGMHLGVSWEPVSTPITKLDLQEHDESRPVRIDKIDTVNVLLDDEQFLIDQQHQLYYSRKNNDRYICDISVDVKKKTTQEHIDIGNQMICIYRCRSPFAIKYTAEILDLYPKEAQAQFVPLFCFPQGLQLYQTDLIPKHQTFAFTLQNNMGVKTYFSALLFYEMATPETIESLGFIERIKKHVIIPKVICFSSRLQFMDQFEALLEQIYYIYLNDNNKIDISKYIQKLVQIQLPLDLTKNCFCFWYKSARDNQKYELRFTLGQLYPPSALKSIDMLFNCLDIQKVVELLHCVLLERRVQLITADISKPAHIINAIQQLLYPFQFMKSAFPILPESYHNLLQIPEPFIIGYLATEQLNCQPTSDTVHVYLDNNIIELFSPLTRLPQNISEELLDRLDQFNKFYIRVQIIRDAFFRMQLSLMKNYHKFYRNGKFNDKEFAQSREPFYSEYCSTIMFTYFVNQKVKLTYFEDSLQRKSQHPYFKPENRTQEQIFHEQDLIEPGSKYESFPITISMSRRS